MDVENVAVAVGEVLASTLAAIRRGWIEEPTALSSYVRTVTLRVAAEVSSTNANDSVNDVLPSQDSPANSPEQARAIERMENALGRLDARDRQLLDRFYLREETKKQICLEMRLTDEQFRTAKNRATEMLRTSNRMGVRCETSSMWQRIRAWVA
jgi:DNA-directed RNA polymerase specialized sigma24 family protein